MDVSRRSGDAEGPGDTPQRRLTELLVLLLLLAFISATPATSTANADAAKADAFAAAPLRPLVAGGVAVLVLSSGAILRRAVAAVLQLLLQAAHRTRTLRQHLRPIPYHWNVLHTPKNILKQTLRRYATGKHIEPVNSDDHDWAAAEAE